MQPLPFSRYEPFNTLPFLPPQQEIETKAVLKALVQASRALAELKVKCAQIPNPAILIDNLMALEAKGSSEIENIFTTHDKLFQASALETHATDANTKEVMLYRHAMNSGLNYMRRTGLTSNAFILIMQEIKRTEMGIRKTPGTRIATPTGEVIYTPPEGEDLLHKLLKNLETFLNLSDHSLDPLIKMAIAHYQFEAIHPFTDGNGRTGRIINILYLIQEKLLDHPILFMSRYIIENKKDYYQCLQGITERGEWERWLIYMLQAVSETAQWTLGIINQIHASMEDSRQLLKEKAHNIYSKELIETIYLQPFCRYQTLIAAGLTKNRMTASKYLGILASPEVGILQKLVFGREVLYLNPKLMKILRQHS